MDTILNCRKCSLCKTQLPFMDPNSEADIMLVGISAKIKKYKDEIPLDNRTRSGKLVEQMAVTAQRQGFKIYRTNLVKCPPTGGDGKLRYPDEIEIAGCFEHILKEIEIVDPKLIVLLGNIVVKTIQKRWKLMPETDGTTSFLTYKYGGRTFAASFHPSYVLRSAKRTEDYLHDYEQLIISMKERI